MTPQELFPVLGGGGGRWPVAAVAPTDIAQDSGALETLEV